MCHAPAVNDPREVGYFFPYRAFGKGAPPREPPTAKQERDAALCVFKCLEKLKRARQKKNEVDAVSVADTITYELGDQRLC